MAAVLHLRTAHLARVVVLKRQDSGETKARHYVAYGLKVGQKSILGGFGQSVIGPKRANRVVPQAVPHPYMMHMLGWGQWVRQGSMRGDARVSGEYATKGLVGERIVYYLKIFIYFISGSKQQFTGRALRPPRAHTSTCA